MRVVIDNLRVIGATSPDSNHLDTTVQRAVPETRKPSALIPRFSTPSTSSQSRVIPEAGDSRPSPASVPDRPMATQTTGARSEPVMATPPASSPTTPVVSLQMLSTTKPFQTGTAYPGRLASFFSRGIDSRSIDSRT